MSSHFVLRAGLVTSSIASHIAVLYLLAIKRTLQPPYASATDNPSRAKSQTQLRYTIATLSIISVAITVATPYAFTSIDPLSQCGIRVLSFFYTAKLLDLALIRSDSPPTNLRRQSLSNEKDKDKPPPAPVATTRDKANYVWSLLTEMRYHSFDIYVPQKGRPAKPPPNDGLWTYGPIVVLPALAYLIPSPATKCAVLLAVIQHGLEGVHSLLHPHCPDTVFYRPFAASSLGEFWSMHWHAGASPFLQSLAYKPVRKLTGSRAAGVMATFSLTGVWHAWAAAPITDQPYLLGVQVWAWFVSLGVGCLLERAVWGERQGGWVQRGCVWGFALGGAGWCWRTAECTCRYGFLRAVCE